METYSQESANFIELINYKLENANSLYRRTGLTNWLTRSPGIKFHRPTCPTSKSIHLQGYKTWRYKNYARLSYPFVYKRFRFATFRMALRKNTKTRLDFDSPRGHRLSDNFVDGNRPTHPLSLSLSTVFHVNTVFRDYPYRGQGKDRFLNSR